MRFCCALLPLPGLSPGANLNLRLAALHHDHQVDRPVAEPLANGLGLALEKALDLFALWRGKLTGFVCLNQFTVDVFERVDSPNRCDIVSGGLRFELLGPSHVTALAFVAAFFNQAQNPVPVRRITLHPAGKPLQAKTQVGLRNVDIHHAPQPQSENLPFLGRFEPFDPHEVLLVTDFESLELLFDQEQFGFDVHTAGHARQRALAEILFDGVELFEFLGAI